MERRQNLFVYPNTKKCHNPMERCSTNSSQPLCSQTSPVEVVNSTFHTPPLSIPHSKVELTTSTADFWLHNGWKEFATHTSIGLWYFLVFRYEENYNWHDCPGYISWKEVPYELKLAVWVTLQVMYLYLYVNFDFDFNYDLYLSIFEGRILILLYFNSGDREWP